MKNMKNKITAVLMILSIVASAQITPGQIWTSPTGVNTMSGTVGFNMQTFSTNIYGGGCFTSPWTGTIQGTYPCNLCVPSYSSPNFFGVPANGNSGAWVQGNAYRAGALINTWPYGSVNSGLYGYIIPGSKDTGVVVVGYSNNNGASIITQSLMLVLCPNAIPVPTAQVSSPVISTCVGSTVQLNNTSISGLIGSTSYKSKYIWSYGSTSVITSPSQSNTVAPLALSFSTAGTYTVALTVQNWSGPNMNQSVKITTINVAANPTLSVPSSSICVGQSATLTVSGNATNYIWLPSNTLATSTVVTPVVSTTYSVMGISGSCTNITTAQVVVNPNPTITASNGTICAGSNHTLVANGASSYTWSSGPVVSPNSTSVYTVTGSTNGCQSAPKQATVVVNALPIVSISGSSTVCVGQSIVLNASGATSYTWSDGSNSSSLSYSTSVVSSTVLSVTGSDGNCSNTASTTVQSVDCTVGLSENVLGKSFNIYPNPSAGVVNISYKGNVQIFDCSGKLVMSSDVDGTIEIADLAVGLYVVRFDGKYSHKLIKQ
jgi:hypothetical protein